MSRKESLNYEPVFGGDENSVGAEYYCELGVSLENAVGFSTLLCICAEADICLAVPWQSH